MTLQPLDGNSVTRWAQVLAPARQLAEVIAQTEFVPKAMRDQPDVVTAAIMYGDEIGIGPMQALVGIHVVEGRPAPSAELMRALILREGHNLTIHEMSGTRCRVSGLRAGRPEAERLVVDWSLDMARAAGLLGRQVWQRYPRAMLLARATSDLARIVFPDVVKGLGYIAEDDSNAEALEAWAPNADPVPPEQPARPTVQRRTTPRPRALEASLAQPAPADPATGEDQPAHQADDGDSDPIDQPVVPPQRHGATVPHGAEPPPLAEGPPRDEPHAHAAGLPPIEPEQPAPEPPPSRGAGPVPIGDGVRRGLLAAWRRVAPVVPNPELARMQRLEWYSHETGRLVESSKDLTRAEGLKLAQQLGKVEGGQAVLNLNAEGWLRVEPWPEQQPTPQPDDSQEGDGLNPLGQTDPLWGDDGG